MIVRDEEQALARCLESVDGIVDEMCIVDTGSSDATVAIARRYGAQVATFDWCDDFAAARNASLSLASGQWILVLDADEVLVDEDRAGRELRAFAAEHPDCGGQVLIENQLDDGESSYSTVTRFFPRSSTWVFAGRVHEQVLRQGKIPRRKETGVRVRHFGYMAAQRDRKIARNEDLLRQVVKRHPADSFSAYQLGHTLAVADRHEEALGYFELAITHCSDDDPYIAHLFEMAASSLRALGHSRQALDWLSNIEADFRDRADTCFLIALLAMDTGDLERARSGFEHCLSLEGTIPRGGPSSPRGLDLRSRGEPGRHERGVRPIRTGPPALPAGSAVPCEPRRKSRGPETHRRGYEFRRLVRRSRRRWTRRLMRRLMRRLTRSRTPLRDPSPSRA